MLKQPIFFPGRINPLEPDLWYFSKFGNWISEHFWKDANAVEAFVLGLIFIAGGVASVTITYIWLKKYKDGL